MVALDTDDQTLLRLIVDRFEHADQGIHQHHRTVWDRLDKLYHSYTDLKGSYATAAPRDRYPLLTDAKTEFGHELFIPYAYSIVETVLPRLLSNRPRMLVLPRDRASERNVENMRALIDRQQNEINYELIVQAAAKSGLIYGLGVQKTSYRKAYVEKQVPVPANFVLRAAGSPYALQTVKEALYDNPCADAINIRDFFWDPMATCIDDARWVVHRTWRDTRYCLDKLATVWDYTDLTMEDLDSGDAANRYQTAHSGPRLAQGMPHHQAPRDTDVHEVLEYHDRTNIVTILDRKWIVASVENEAYPGRLPFQAYRPTHILNQFVGKGEIEPIEDLQREMNALRTHRFWNAQMVMHQAFAYSDGMIDPHRFKIGPGVLLPVQGNPNEVLMPLHKGGDIPHSGYREAQEIAADIERTSGISDSSSGADTGAAQTATGIQLVQAAANARIQLKTRRVEVELIREGCRHWGALNQRYILERREVQVPAGPTPEEPDRTSIWLTLGPEQLAGEFDYEPEGGSTTPENIPQKRQDAQIKMAALGQMGQLLDARRVAVSILEDLGYKNPETYLAPEIHVPPETLNMIAEQLVAAGMDQGQVEQIVGGALNAALDAEQQEMMGNQTSSELPREPGPEGEERAA